MSGRWVRGVPQFDHYGTDAEGIDCIDLSYGRVWIMIWEDGGHAEDIPRLWLEHYREGPIDERFGNESDVTRRVWFHPEDLPALIAQSSDGGVSWLKKLVIPSDQHYTICN